MSKKQDAYYFQNLTACAGYACQAAHMLRDILTDFHPEDAERRLGELHEIEHTADKKKQELREKLITAFITPVEREDLAELSHQIDVLTDKIEEVFIRIYINNVQRIRPDAVRLLDLVIQCCEAVGGLMEEFADFRHSRRLGGCIRQIQALEEEADQLYISSMRKLHAGKYDVPEIIAWREIYSYLEKCADACEHVADVVGRVVMKNS